ncbi:MAG: glutathione S-transferase family protein [Novosphingobium sp.]|nr:glutathione S-transferase family protein [Novosphingobium sp.]
MIELYGMSSPNVRKVLIALEEMALDYEVRHVAVFRGHQFEEDFLALNPMAKVPVICDPEGPAGVEPIFESGAILVYLAENYGGQFLPLAGPERYAVLKWLFMQVANVGPAIGTHNHFSRIAEDNEYAAGRYRRMTAQVFRALDRRLGEAAFLGGEAYSIADMATYPWALRYRRFGMQDAECPHLVAWVDGISKRPAIAASDKAIKRLGEQDSKDVKTATPEEMAKFSGKHIAAPSAEEAGRLPSWWAGRGEASGD